jgi:hypothetical protein
MKKYYELIILTRGTQCGGPFQDKETALNQQRLSLGYLASINQEVFHTDIVELEMSDAAYDDCFEPYWDEPDFQVLLQAHWDELREGQEGAERRLKESLLTNMEAR